MKPENVKQPGAAADSVAGGCWLQRLVRPDHHHAKQSITCDSGSTAKCSATGRIGRTAAPNALPKLAASDSEPPESCAATERKDLKEIAWSNAALSEAADK